SGDFLRRPKRALVAGAAATRCRCPFANGHVLDAALPTTGTRTPRRTSASKPIVYGPLEEGLLLVEAMSDMSVGVSWRIVQLPLRHKPRGPGRSRRFSRFDGRSRSDHTMRPKMADKEHGITPRHRARLDALPEPQSKRATAGLASEAVAGRRR